MHKHLKTKCKGKKGFHTGEIEKNTFEDRPNATDVSDTQNVDNDVTNITEEGVNRGNQTQQDKRMKIGRMGTSGSKAKEQCQECPKTFETKNGLRKHMKTHRNIIEQVNRSDTISLAMVEDGGNGNNITELGQIEVFATVEI